MRRAAIVLAALSLSGCLPDQPKDVEACMGEASRFYQLTRAVDANDPPSRYIIECMAAKGYDFTVSPADCDSHHPLATQPACYVPANWFAGLLDAARRSLKLN